MMQSTETIVKIRFHSENPTTLFFFPYAGGFAGYYQQWKSYFNDDINLIGIEYPGRGLRSKQGFSTNFQALVKDSLSNILPYLKGRCLFMGESLGAYLAYELALLLQTSYNYSPNLITVISAVPPQNFEGSKILSLLCKSDSEIQKSLGNFGAINTQISFDDNFMSYWINIVRADLKIISSYSFRKKGLLKGRLISMVGNDDAVCQDKDLQLNWGKLSKRFSFKSFTGGHFFSGIQRGQVADYIIEQMHDDNE